MRRGLRHAARRAARAMIAGSGDRGSTRRSSIVLWKLHETFTGRAGPSERVVAWSIGPFSAPFRLLLFSRPTRSCLRYRIALRFFSSPPSQRRWARRRGARRPPPCSTTSISRARSFRVIARTIKWRSWISIFAGRATPGSTPAFAALRIFSRRRATSKNQRPRRARRSPIASSIVQCANRRGSPSTRA